MTMFRGLSAFPITPADASGRVDTAALRGLLRRLAAVGVDSIGLLGSTGTYPYLDRAERRRAVEAAVDEVGGRVPLLVGIGALRTDDAVALGRDARAAGADAVLLAPVSYLPLLDEEVFTHFATVADAVGLPLCVYNNPGTTHFSFSPALVARLSRVPHVMAVKNPAPATGAGPMLQALRAEVAEGFALGVSVDANAAEALLAGAEGWYSVAAGLFPLPCVRLMRAVQAGNADAARRENEALRPLWNLFAAHTSLRVMYAAANQMGLCRAEPPRPVLPLDAAAQEEVAAVVRHLGKA